MKVFISLVLCLLLVPVTFDDATDEVLVSVMKEDSVTLYTGIKTIQQVKINWYFNNTRIAQIRGDQSKICEDDECKERFRARLKLDHQTGSLTVTDTRTTDSGLYNLQIISKRIIQKIFNVRVLAVSGKETDKTKTKSAMEGESVTLDTGLVKNRNDSMTWFFNDNLIAEITGDQSNICTVDECKERFRDRLKLDQIGSLTIMNISFTDAGEYKLQNNSRIHLDHSIISIKRFSITVTALSGAVTDGVSVSLKEGDSVILHTDVEANQDRIRWYFIDTRIAQITEDQSKICTDVQCNEGTERFRDRLKLDQQTGSLTITNTRTTDSGDYKVQIIRKKIIQKIFNVAVFGVDADQRYEVKSESVKEGESVTLDANEIKNPNDEMTWYFNDIPIAQITGDQRDICTDDECKERFRDRLELDHQTGSLTITNTRTTDSGEYKLQIIYSIRRRHSISISRFKRFSVTVIDPGQSTALIAGICAAVTVSLLVIAAVIFFSHKKQKPDIL